MSQLWGIPQPQYFVTSLLELHQTYFWKHYICHKEDAKFGSQNLATKFGFVPDCSSYSVIGHRRSLWLGQVQTWYPTLPHDSSFMAVYHPGRLSTVGLVPIQPGSRAHSTDGECMQILKLHLIERPSRRVPIYMIKQHPWWLKDCYQDVIYVSGFNTLWPSDDAVWWYGTGSTLAQVMACCLTAPSHYLNQCWLFISGVQWQWPHTCEGNFTRDTSAINDQHCGFKII